MINSARAGFSARFREALAEAGYQHSQLGELGKLFGVTGQAVRKWLNEEAIPASSKAAKVAETLGVRRAWLLDGEPPMRSLQINLAENSGAYTAERQGGLTISGEEYRLLQNYRSLPQPLRASVESMLVNISKEIKTPNKN